MNHNLVNVNSSPEPSHSPLNAGWDSLKYAKSNFTENYNTPTSPAEDQLSILSKSPFQQDKLTKATLSNNPEVYDQPQVNIYPEERKHFSQLLLNDNFNNTYLRRSIDHISAPIDTHTPEEIFWPMSNNKHFRRILAYATGVGAPGALPARRPPSPRAPGEPRPHARFQESLWDLAPRPVKREDNPSSPQRQSKLSRIQGSNEGSMHPEGNADWSKTGTILSLRHSSLGK